MQGQGLESKQLKHRSDNGQWICVQRQSMSGYIYASVRQSTEAS